MSITALMKARLDKEILLENDANAAALDFKGTPTAPTAAKTVNSTQIATTAFVHLLAGAANNGGIVDSLLAQNGYVKFANGLILQWGYGNSESTQTFPIKFTNSVIGIYGSKRAINYEYTFALLPIYSRMKRTLPMLSADWRS